MTPKSTIPATTPPATTPLDDAFGKSIEQSSRLGATVHAVTPADYAALGALHDRIFGPGPLTRTAYRIREGLPHHTPFCRLARLDGTAIAFIRFARLRIGGTTQALMLGPLGVAPENANQGHGRRLIWEGLAAARAAGVPLVILVGDAPYYGRLGFVPIPKGQITMPGPVDVARLLAIELVPGTLATTAGMIAGDR